MPVGHRANADAPSVLYLLTLPLRISFKKTSRSHPEDHPRSDLNAQRKPIHLTPQHWLLCHMELC